MIERIIIENFKAHKKAVLELSGLNIIAGKNGMGKSSIIQSLLLLRQSYLAQKDIEGLLLNGDLVIIGNSQDAFCDSADGNEISFTLAINGSEFVWHFIHSVDKNYLPQNKGGQQLENFSDYKAASLFTSNFQYIAAEHIASKEAHERNTYYVEQLNQISEKAGDAKFTVHYLSVHGGKKISSEALSHPTARSLKLKDQVDAWLKEVSPDISSVVEENASSNTLRIRYTFETPVGPTREYKPENVGFGVSYALPILVSILSAKAGSIVLIENPESHLHPAAQAALGRLLCLAAQSGIQIIMETHSDHMINAALVNAKVYLKDSKTGISVENVKIYFVDREKGEHVSKVIPVLLNEYGIISKPPPDFFDQMDKDLDILLNSSETHPDTNESIS